MKLIVLLLTLALCGCGRMNSTRVQKIYSCNGVVLNLVLSPGPNTLDPHVEFHGVYHHASAKHLGRYVDEFTLGTRPDNGRGTGI